MNTLPIAASSPKTVTAKDRAAAPLNDVIDLHKIRATLYSRIAADTTDPFLKTFFHRMSTDSRRFRTELSLFADRLSSPISDRIMQRIESVWKAAGDYLETNNMLGLLQTWQSLEEVMIDAYLKVASNAGVRGNFRKLILRQIDCLRKDRNVYRFMESIYLQQLA